MSTEKVKNKRITLKDYVTGYPKEEDLLLGSSDLELKVPTGSNAVLLKNLYLSCDPYMRGKMSKPLVKSYTDAFTPGSVSAIPCSYSFFLFLILFMSRIRCLVGFYFVKAADLCSAGLNWDFVMRM
ncbi:2-alkenal reductase (NADP(+)-dependent)-like [Dendrobium catenatum]|uniref:NADP-dependent alkenal double bond reductase P1 n=1 Tax=Dendrobium catenatum TaxID=906689 RepID=A0A2I0X5Z9_9ASPA|nr:2-alkenal reductase (NADP(+)-dependent)-like [Dendrobium catenatum]PKU83327.1 NADP-dependent alkenal double bond reductase P1 [Dendrobium catenatum]